MNFDHHVYLHDVGSENQIKQKLDLILTKLTSLEQKMATVDDFIQSESDETGALSTLGTAIQALLDGQAVLQQQLTDLLSGNVIPPALQAKVDAAFAASQANKQSVLDDIAKLAPPTPPAPPAA